MGVTEPFEKTMFYEPTGNCLNDVIPLVQSWAMTPWEQQVGQLILDMASLSSAITVVSRER